MLKTKVKFMIIALGFFVALCLFNTNTVNAATEDLQNILDLIPNEIKLDITELEGTKMIDEISTTKGADLIDKQIKELLKENNISLDGVNIVTQYTPIYGTDEDYLNMHNANIVIQKNGEMLTKKISVVYKNSNQYNNIDEQYVKNLKINHPDYIEVDLDKIDAIYDNFCIEMSNLINNYYTNIVNDNSVELNIGYSAGWTEYGIFVGIGEGNTGLGIFKNEILYNVVDIPRNLTNILVPVIDVPNTINEEDLKEYVLSIINNYINKSGYQEPVESTQCTLKKGATVKGVDIPNGYTITFNGTDSYDLIIRQEESTLQIKDEATNIKIDTTTAVLPVNTKLVADEIKEGETFNLATKVLKDLVDKINVYDITLQSNGVKVQPNGKVKVSIPIPEGMDTNNLVVYRIDEAGNKTEYIVTVETIDNIQYATFETDHFSIYVLGEKINTPTAVAEGEKDDTPKTGTNNVVLNNLGLIVGLGTVAIITKGFIK